MGEQPTQERDTSSTEVVTFTGFVKHGGLVTPDVRTTSEHTPPSQVGCRVHLHVVTVATDPHHTRKRSPGRGRVGPQTRALSTVYK